MLWRVRMGRRRIIKYHYHYQRQLLFAEGIVRFQHQATQVQIADILTKNLGSKAQFLGKEQLKLLQPSKLPGSYKLHLTRHNEMS